METTQAAYDLRFKPASLTLPVVIFGLNSVRRVHVFCSSRITVRNPRLMLLSSFPQTVPTSSLT